MYSSKDFYTQFADSYEHYSSSKKAYISAVDGFIKENVGQIKTMVDVGAGNGKRGKRVADMLNVNNFTLIDNSDGMIALLEDVSDARIVRADISSPEFKSEIKYEVVLCLWNVLGHVPNGGRVVALKNLASLMGDNGSIFMDINNRYNIAHYGPMAVLKNIFKDVFLPSIFNGDFNLTFDTETGPINTSVHIFKSSEIEYLIKLAGLTIEKRSIINYITGEKAKNIFGGQLVYKLSKL